MYRKDFLPKPLDWQKGLKLAVDLRLFLCFSSSKAIRLAKRIETKNMQNIVIHDIDLPKPLDWQKGLKRLVATKNGGCNASSKAIRLAKRIETK